MNYTYALSYLTKSDTKTQFLLMRDVYHKPAHFDLQITSQT